MLARIDLVAERIDAGNRVMDMQPWVQRSDVDAVSMYAHLDAVIENRPEWRKYLFMDDTQEEAIEIAA